MSDKPMNPESLEKENIPLASEALTKKVNKFASPSRRKGWDCIT
jgi:hypothetical protein